MGIPKLTRKIAFPPPERADESGVVAYGGDLSVERLLEAYRHGIFPWSGPGEPLLWWCPDPRLVLFPGELKLSRSLRSTIRRNVYTIRTDTAFAAVIHACAVIERPGEDGTWISAEVERAYTALHNLGHAHSVEAWQGDELAGGLYGVQLGRAFFGESMFSHQRDASKVALAALCAGCADLGIDLIDCQVTTEHLLSLGAREIPRAEFLRLLRTALAHPTNRQPWPLFRPPDSGSI